MSAIRQGTAVVAISAGGTGEPDMSSASDIIANAGKGAAAGMSLGPIGAAAGALLGAAPGLLDLLGVHLFGDDGEAVANAALTVARAVTGKADPVADDIAALPPDQVALLRVQLAQIAAGRERARLDAEQAERVAALADTADARRQTVALTQAGSKVAWGAPMISVVVLAAFGSVLIMMLTQTVPAGSEQGVSIMLGALTTMATSVVGYWVGSSAGSARKDDLLHQSVPARLG